MINSLNLGNQAIKIPSDRLSESQRKDVLESKEVQVYGEMLNNCENKLKKISISKNVDVLEYNALFNMHCSQYEKLYYDVVRKQFRKKYHDDQKKEFYMPTGGNFYNPYNPYLQKYHGEYLRSYQEF